MTKLKIPHDALIFIGAMEQLVRGRKARARSSRRRRGRWPTCTSRFIRVLPRSTRI
jgi:hypothetical protein